MEKTRLISLGITAIIILVASFAMINNLVGVETVQSPGPATPSAHSGQAPVYGYKVVKVYPHNTSAFTEGLLFHDGYLYESTGVYGNSSLRKVDLSTGKVLRIKRLPDWVFAEGLAFWKDSLVQLTWRSGVGFVYDCGSFNQTGDFRYPNEGWGLTGDGKHLIMSDGTDTLRILNPDTFYQIGSIRVTDNGTSVDRLNELEYIKGDIYANVWTSDRIAIIDPDTGIVKGWIDLNGLLDRGSTKADVLNGIAYDAENDSIFVTGKYWPWLFLIEPTSSTGSGQP